MDWQCTLPYEDFQLLAKKLVEQSLKLSDGWQLREVSSGPHRDKVYLVKRCTQQLLPKEVGVPEVQEEVSLEVFLEELAGDTSSLTEEDNDLASIGVNGRGEEHMGLTPRTMPINIYMEYHIVHSYSYQVPLLYFNATYSNGKPLSLAEIWRLLTVSSATDKWGVVTQQDHPYLGRPFCLVHPCHTASTMGKAKQCLGNVDGKWNYLTSWLSMFGLLTGLHVPLGYAAQHQRACV